APERGAHASTGVLHLEGCHVGVALGGGDPSVAEDLLDDPDVDALLYVTATPYGLWLIRAVYADTGTDPAPLTGPLSSSPATLRAHLLDELIPALTKARPPSTESGDHFLPRRRLDPATTRRYLTYLARAFPPATTRDIAWWRIAGTHPNANRLVRGTFGLVGGLVGASCSCSRSGMWTGRWPTSICSEWCSRRHSRSRSP